MTNRLRFGGPMTLTEAARLKRGQNRGQSVARDDAFGRVRKFVHGDAIDKSAGARFPWREPTLGTYIESRLCVIGSPGNGRRGLRVNPD